MDKNPDKVQEEEKILQAMKQSDELLYSNSPFCV